MDQLRSTFLAVLIGSALLARAAVAQSGSSSSLTHTVSVTVPPRVKVKLRAVATPLSAVRVGSVRSAPTPGLSLSVAASRAWVLSIGSKVSSARRTASTRWSLAPTSGFSTLTSAGVTVASGALSAEPSSATVFFRSGTSNHSAGEEDGSASSVVLTMTAP